MGLMVRVRGGGLSTFCNAESDLSKFVFFGASFGASWPLVASSTTSWPFEDLISSSTVARAAAFCCRARYSARLIFFRPEVVPDETGVEEECELMVVSFDCTGMTWRVSRGGGGAGGGEKKGSIMIRSVLGRGMCSEAREGSTVLAFPVRCVG